MRGPPARCWRSVSVSHQGGWRQSGSGARRRSSATMGPGRPIRSIPIGRRPGAAGARRLHPVVMRAATRAKQPLCPYAPGQAARWCSRSRSRGCRRGAWRTARRSEGERARTGLVDAQPNSNTSSQVVTRSREGIRGGQAVEQRHLFEQTQIATVALDGSAALSGGGRAEAADVPGPSDGESQFSERGYHAIRDRGLASS